MKNPYLFLIVFVIGAAVLFLFDIWITIIIGVLMCVGAVILGVFTIAEPEFLDGDGAAAESKTE